MSKPLYLLLVRIALALSAATPAACANCEDQPTAPHPKGDVETPLSDKLRAHGRPHLPKLGATRTLERILAARAGSGALPDEPIDAGSPTHD
jgi:hypothetical protein